MTPKHLSVPLRKGTNGFFATVSGEDAIVENIRQIIFVGPNQRLFRNDIGSLISTLVWDPIDEIFESLMETYIRAGIDRWEPRVRVLSVVPMRELQANGDMRVSIFIQYRLVENPVRIVSETFQRIFGSANRV